MRDKRIEAKIITIGKRYHKKMWIESSNQNNMMMITPKKPTQIQTLIQKDQTRQNLTMQNLNRPRQHQNTISRCLNFNAEYEGRAKDKENETKSPPHEMELPGSIDKDDYSEEEVIYSEGEPFEMLYPNNTWDSDDTSLEEHLSQPSEWI